MRDEDLDQWLASARQDLTDELGAALDVEAGLRDALLPARRVALTDDLRAVLDVDAGLAAIIPATSSAADEQRDDSAAASSETSTSADDQTVSATARLLNSLPDADRLALRGDPAIISLALVLLLAIAHIQARALDHAISRVRVLGHGRARDRTYDRVRALAHELDNRLAFARVSDPEIDLDHHLASASALARALNIELARDPEDGLADALHRHVGFARDLDGHLALALALTRDLAGRLAREQTHNLARHIARDLDRSGDFDLDRHLESARGLQRDLGRARSDFTNADLREADLAGSPLTGIRWSRATQWPPDWKGQIEQRSEEVEPGVFEVRGGTEHADTSIVLADV